MSSRAPLPLFEWMPPTPARRPRRRAVALGAAIGLGLIGLAAAIDPAPRLIWNPSASAPVGLWRIAPGAPVMLGDMVLARTPDSVRHLAAVRHYLPANVPLLKRVVAADGDVVCALGQAIFVNGRWIAERRAADRQDRPLPWWSGCRTLSNGAVFLLMDRTPDSFDGRYFGPIPRASIIGKATPLWVD